MEPQYRDGTLRRECCFCNRKFGLHRVEQHEASCWARPHCGESNEQPSSELTVVSLTSFPCQTCGQTCDHKSGLLQPTSHETRCEQQHRCSKYQQEHDMLCKLIQQAKHNHAKGKSPV
jgi:hypothetical protein